MDFKWKLLAVIVTVLKLVQRIQCIDEIDLASLASLSSNEEASFISPNHIIITKTELDKLQDNSKESFESPESSESSESSEYITTAATTEKTRNTETSKSAMDIITIIWYTSTFLALAAFFFLMACSDRRCGRNNDLQNNSQNQRNRNDSMQCPPSPAPSYREFAPPSYESVMKQEIYVIPVDSSIKILPLKDNYCIEDGSSTTIITAVPQQNNIVGINNNIKIEIVNEQSKNG